MIGQVVQLDKNLCNSELRIGGDGAVVAICNKPKGHEGRHLYMDNGKGYGCAEMVYMSRPNEK